MGTGAAQLVYGCAPDVGIEYSSDVGGIEYSGMAGLSALVRTGYRSTQRLSAHGVRQNTVP